MASSSTLTAHPGTSLERFMFSPARPLEISGYEEVSGAEEVYVPLALSYEYLKVPASVVLSPSTVKPPPQAVVVLIVTTSDGVTAGLPSGPLTGFSLV